MDKMEEEDMAIKDPLHYCKHCRVLGLYLAQRIEELELKFLAARHVAARFIGGEFTPTLHIVDRQIEEEIEMLKEAKK